jgi:hypothetical protein
VGALLVVVGLSTFLVADVRPPVIKSADFGDPLLAVLAGTAIAAGAILLAEGVFRGPWRSAPWITALATTALPVIFGHGIVLVVLADRPLDASVTAFLAAVALPWLAALVIARSRRLSTVLL